MNKVYLHWLSHLCRRERIHPDMSVLVLCGSQMDAAVFKRLNFTEVTISNLDEGHEGTWDTGAGWRHENAESLKLENNAYDLVVVHAGLHHCRQPHKALCEMYRVAGKGIVVVEPCENFMTRFGQCLGVGQRYEVHAVAANGLVAGGVFNSAIPNFVYRWSRREVEQTIAACAPEFRHNLESRSYLIVHWHDLFKKRNPLRLMLMLGLYVPMKLCSLILRNFGNVMGVYIEKAQIQSLHPWLESVEGEVQPNKTWFDRHIQVDPVE